MKKTPLLAILVSLFTFTGLVAAPAERDAKRFKGVELYSWKTDAGGWRYALLDGTNRIKPAEEVKAPETRIKSLEALKAAISKLAEGERLSWGDRLGAFDTPPKAVRDEILKAAKEAGVKLHIDLC